MAERFPDKALYGRFYHGYYIIHGSTASISVFQSPKAAGLRCTIYWSINTKFI